MQFPVKKEVWTCSDGKTFDKEVDAKEYEQNLDFMSFLRKCQYSDLSSLARLILSNYHVVRRTPATIGLFSPRS